MNGFHSGFTLAAWVIVLAFVAYIGAAVIAAIADTVRESRKPEDDPTKWEQR